MTMWLGCCECGDVTSILAESDCGCEGNFRVLASVAEKLEFKLTMAERADEAAAVARAAEAMKR